MVDFCFICPPYFQSEGDDRQIIYHIYDLSIVD